MMQLRRGVLLRDAIESLSDGFALFDPDDRMILCNQAFPAHLSRICGYFERRSRVFRTCLTIGHNRRDDRFTHRT